ncbi:hypothetical protein AN4100.2 [Aspergillus nidulans FGSC A4]|uniref:BZIP domain-containing protein n=1 Tax=Emericella nidulans (strain FGSC A4 / ATCC 38163 / CBS 112.46 / NRRL 194 / M139) TaxID=227321 RepID=Q5B5T0_EMENI|nr:hypothetical protein [Aspergillus nidulans FGSC A4]EAA59361.1 hypothetical protein AN4100.2 [Aspergillus nidulans FGSC A4]CBF74708.1 TPA: conserved hypothetical protein [Aspergillus nidulans FGSC A4]|eukprot:XP_661704.1 hypothetical protein AN4100.2 [Aspergillus nidulans FGSC A4]
MTSALEKKRLDKLARVRENQRKSRARRQDHLQDLERKVLSLQQELDRRDVEHRLAAQRLEAENKRLRDLHFFLGVPPNALEEYLRMVDNPVAAQKVAIPAIRRDPSEARSRVAEVKSEPSCSTEQSPRSESVPSQEPVIGACKPSANKNESQSRPQYDILRHRREAREPVQRSRTGRLRNPAKATKGVHPQQLRRSLQSAESGSISSLG